MLTSSLFEIDLRNEEHKLSFYVVCVARRSHEAQSIVQSMDGSALTVLNFLGWWG